MPESDDPRSGRAARRSRRTGPLLILIGALGTVAAVVWGVVLVGTGQERMEAMARAELPGALQLEVEPETRQIVYLELPASETPIVETQLVVEVTGPDGGSVAVEPYGLDLDYRLFDRLGEAQAYFTPPTAGTYSVEAHAGSVYEDATFAVSSDRVEWTVWDLIAPAILLALSLTVIALGAISMHVARRQAD